MKQLNHLNLEQKKSLKQIINRMERITLIKFRTTMLKLSLCDYSKAYVLVQGTVTVVGQGANAAATSGDRNDKELIFKLCTIYH